MPLKFSLMSNYFLKKDQNSSHDKIISFLKSMPSNKKQIVLDVGCSKGFIGQSLKDSNFEFYGVDCDKKDAEIASKYYKNVKIMDLDKDKIDYSDKKFDILIFADILEHLKNPKELIVNTKPLLKKNGLIIISTGNIANIYIRISLLFGNFSYAEKGILDKTHLKFFTLKTMKQFIKETGLKMLKEEFTSVPFYLVNSIFSKQSIFYIVYKIYYIFIFLNPSLFSYQFIFYCKKNEEN